jgi:hypothetical protein
VRIRRDDTKKVIELRIPVFLLSKVSTNCLIGFGAVNWQKWKLEIAVSTAKLQFEIKPNPMAGIEA